MEQKAKMDRERKERIEKARREKIEKEKRDRELGLIKEESSEKKVVESVKETEKEVNLFEQPLFNMVVRSQHVHVKLRKIHQK